MTRDDNPEYFEHACIIIEAVMTAEHRMIEKKDILNKLKSKEITPQQYIEAVAEEFIRPTKYEEIKDL